MPPHCPQCPQPQSIPPPEDFGLPPEKFPQWRPIQVHAMEDILTTASEGIRFIAPVIATGGGKSALAVAAAQTLGSKFMYLTATKNLQKQLMDDFEVAGLVDVRGRGNYRCINGRSNQVSCEEGSLLGCSAG